jgi:hypothetical protein
MADEEESMHAKRESLAATAVLARLSITSDKARTVVLCPKCRSNLRVPSTGAILEGVPLEKPDPSVGIAG